MNLRTRLSKIEQAKSNAAEAIVIFTTRRGRESNRFEYDGRSFTRLEAETDSQLKARILGPHPKKACIHIITQKP